METGVNISGEQVFYDSGDPRRMQECMECRTRRAREPYIDFNDFFQSGDWMDLIKSKVDVEENMQMASRSMGEGPFMTT